MFDPLSGIEHLPDDAPFISEGRILRDILYDNLWRFDGCACLELSHDEEIPEHLYGLFVLLQTRDAEVAEALSHRPEKAFRIIGMVMRVWHNGGGDHEATRFLEDEFHSAVRSDARLRRASALLPLMRWISNEEEGFGASTFTGMLASIAVGELPRDGVVGHSGLQWTAGEILLSAPAESVGQEASKIISFLENFRDTIASADSDELLAISNEGTGGIVRLLVKVIHDAEVHRASRVLESIRGIDEDTLRYFPLLKEDVDRAYKEFEGDAPNRVIP